MNTLALEKTIEEYSGYMTAGADILSKIVADKPWLDDFAKNDLAKNIKDIEMQRDVELPKILDMHCKDQISEEAFMMRLERCLEQVECAVEHLTSIFDSIKPSGYYHVGDKRNYHPSTDYNGGA